MTRKRKRRESVRSRRQHRLHYPVATIAHYGPDDRTVTKIAVGIVEAEDAEPIMERWIGPDVLTNPEIQLQIAGFIQAHGVQQVVTMEGVLGCPHEEGIDFPAGEECPYCPFWREKQGARAVSRVPPAAPYRQMKELSRQHTHLLWESAQAGMPLTGEDARLVQAMREHAEYGEVWDHLNELSNEEIERDGINPLLHVTIHSTVENQIASDNPKEVRQVVEALTRRGLSRHEAVHCVGGALSEEIFHILKEQRPFDEARYVRKLRQLVHEAR